MLRILALVAALLASPALAGTIYVDTGGSATNSGSTDQNSANLTGSAATDSTTTITLDGSPDLSGVVTSGANQSSIYLTNSTVANRKIYWITAKDDGADTVTVDTAPSCTAGACGAWAIGGRFVWTPASIEAALRAGDTVIINNSPATRTSAFLTTRTSGSTSAGFITVRGKTGVRPVVNITNTSNVISGSGQNFWWFENLELDQDGASGNVANELGNQWTFRNVKIVDGGGIGISTGYNGLVVLNSEITGVSGDGIRTPTGNNAIISGNYIHDVGGDGIEIAVNDPKVFIENNVIDTVTGRGIYFSATGSTTAATIPSTAIGNTVYNSGDSGLEVADADTLVIVQNNILVENGNAAGEYNAEWAAGAAEYGSSHQYNDFYHSNCQGSGTGGPACVSGLTVNATELSSDPLLTNPGSGDFTLQATSPAISAGYPGQLLGATGQGYLDLGPQQRQPSAGGAHVVGG